MNVPINPSAPAKSTAELIINAPAKYLWQVLTAIDQWPAWQSAVTASKLSGPLTEGTTFTWKAGGLSFVSQIHTVRPYTEFGWTGRTIGTSAIHNWFFEEHEGKTILRIEESLQGFLPGLFKSYFQKTLDNGIKNNLLELQKAVESYP